MSAIGRKLISLLMAGILTVSVGATYTTTAFATEFVAGYSMNVECISGNLTLRGILTMPDVYDNEKVPMVILSHGFMSSYSEMNSSAAALAEAGYASLRFNFAGTSPSDGQFIDMTVWTEVDDLHAILDYAKTLEFVDVNNIFLAGNSFGGMVSAMVAPTRLKEVRAMCLWYPAMCFADDARNGHIQAATFDTENLPEYLVINSRFTVGKNFLETSLALDPYVHVSGYTKGVLIIHGTADNLVPYSCSERLLEKYESAELVPIAGAGHGFRGSDSTTAIQRMIQFFDDQIYTSDPEIDLHKSILLDIINEAEKLVGSDEYNNTYWFIRDNLDNTIVKANEVCFDTDTTIEEIVSAWCKLVDAMGYLVAIPADYAKLSILVDLANNLDLTKYNTGVQVFETALANAKNVLEDIFAAQDEVDSAYTALLKAITGMRYTVNKSMLQALYDEVNGIDTSLYTPASVLVFTNALNNAKAVLANTYATQDETDAAYIDLNQARIDLKPLSEDGKSTDPGKENPGTSNESKDPTIANGESGFKGNSNASAPKTGDIMFIGTVIILGLAVLFIISSRKKRTI